MLNRVKQGDTRFWDRLATKYWLKYKERMIHYYNAKSMILVESWCCLLLTFSPIFETFCVVPAGNLPSSDFSDPDVKERPRWAPLIFTSPLIANPVHFFLLHLTLICWFFGRASPLNTKSKKSVNGLIAKRNYKRTFII